ncbi:YncE family protein [bacterium]|nr:YncE family protein [bacterium]
MSIFQLVIAPALLAAVLLYSGCSDSDSTTSASLVVDFPAAYVVMGEQGSLAVIDLRTDQLAGALPLRKMNRLAVSWPHHVSLSPDKARIAVGAVGADLSGGHGGHGDAGGSAVVVNAVTGATIASRDTESGIHNVAFSPDGTTLWFAEMSDSGQVHVVNSETLQSIATLPAGDEPAEVTFSSDGHLAFAANGASADVTVYDVASRQYLRTIPVGENPVGAWPGGNGWMYVDNENSRTISVFHHDSSSVSATIDLGFKPGYAALLTARNELWVSNADSGKVVIFEQSDSGWSRVAEIATGADAHAIAFTSDGVKAYITNQGAGTVSVVDTASRAKITDVSVGHRPNGIVLRELNG